MACSIEKEPWFVLAITPRDPKPVRTPSDFRIKMEKRKRNFLLAQPVLEQFGRSVELMV